MTKREKTNYELNHIAAKVWDQAIETIHDENLSEFDRHCIDRVLTKHFLKMVLFYHADKIHLESTSNGYDRYFQLKHQVRLLINDTVRDINDQIGCNNPFQLGILDLLECLIEPVPPLKGDANG